MFLSPEYFYRFTQLPIRDVATGRNKSLFRAKPVTTFSHPIPKIQGSHERVFPNDFPLSPVFLAARTGSSGCPAARQRSPGSLRSFRARPIGKYFYSGSKRVHRRGHVRSMGPDNSTRQVSEEPVPARIAETHRDNCPDNARCGREFSKEIFIVKARVIGPGPLIACSRARRTRKINLKLDKPRGEHEPGNFMNVTSRMN